MGYSINLQLAGMTLHDSDDMIQEAAPTNMLQLVYNKTHKPAKRPPVAASIPTIKQYLSRDVPGGLLASKSSKTKIMIMLINCAGVFLVIEDDKEVKSIAFDNGEWMVNGSYTISNLQVVAPPLGHPFWWHVSFLQPCSGCFSLCLMGKTTKSGDVFNQEEPLPGIFKHH